MRALPLISTVCVALYVLHVLTFVPGGGYAAPFIVVTPIIGLLTKFTGFPVIFNEPDGVAVPMRFVFRPYGLGIVTVWIAGYNAHPDGVCAGGGYATPLIVDTPEIDVTPVSDALLNVTNAGALLYPVIFKLLASIWNPAAFREDILLVVVSVRLPIFNGLLTLMVDVPAFPLPCNVLVSNVY